MARSPRRDAHRAEVAGPLEARRTAHQKLPAPDRSVAAVAGAVVDRPHRGTELAVLGQAGREVGVVVLDPEGLDALALERLARGEVVRMQIVGDHGRLDAEQALEVGHPLAERAQGLPIAQVADVVAHPGSTSLGQAEGVLELRAAGQQRRSLQRKGQRSGHEPARAAEHQRRAAAGDRAQHRVIGAGLDRPVVGEHDVRDAAEASHGVVVLVRDGLVGDIAAGHHQRAAGVAQQQMMQRRVGQHHAEVGRTGAPPLPPPRRRAGGGRSRSGARGRQSSSTSAGVSSTSSRAASRSGAISAKGRSSRRLRESQGGHRLVLVGAAGQVITPDALDRHHQAILERLDHGPERIAHVQHAAAARSRAAARARSPGRRWAGRGSGGPRDRRTRPGRPGTSAKPAIVVSGRSYGHAAHDREARPAVGAVRRTGSGGGGRRGRTARAGSPRRWRRRGTRARRARRPCSLSTIAKPVSPVGARSSGVTRSTSASGGASDSRRARNCSTATAGPSTSSSTPRWSLSTHPASSSSPASRWT